MYLFYVVVTVHVDSDHEGDYDEIIEPLQKRKKTSSKQGMKLV